MMSKIIYFAIYAKHFVVLLFCVFALNFSGKAQTYSKVSSRNYDYSEMGTGTSKTLYVRNSGFVLSLCNGGLFGTKNIKKATLNGVLNLGEDYNFGSSTYNYEVQLTINGYTTFTGGSPVFTQSRTLELDCNGSSCQPEQQFSIDFTTQYNTINRFEVLATLTAHSGLSTTQDSLDLHVFYEEEFIYGFNSTNPSNIALTSLGQTVSNNPVTFQWTSSCGAPDFEIQVLRLYNISTSNITTESTIQALVDWNQALSIETGSSATSIKLTLAEGSGYYVWRVRPIGNAYEGGIANSRNWGPWNDDTIFTQGATVDLTSGSSYSSLFFYNQFDDNKNWIYSRSFVEGDVRNNTPINIGENITYANGLQMVKQKQVKLNTENEILVNQTIQDFSGRASMVTMAAPVDSVKLGYVNRYIKNSLDSLYTATDFDADANYNNATTTAIGTNSLLSQYYSNSNSNTTIPNAEGFPFSRTLYFRDGTNRPKEQSSPGFQHRIKVSDSTRHTVRNMYSAVADLELVRVFGDEAPIDTSVHKMITIDANNSASVTYVSKEGQTIATCMSKPGSTLLDSLDSQLSAGFTVIDTIRGNIPYSENGFSSVKNVCFTQPTSLTLNYDILPALYGDTCSGICMSCDYKVTFFVTNQEDTAGTWSHTLIINPDSCVNNTLSSYTNSSLTFDAGCYVIERRIEANTIDTITGYTYFAEQDSILDTVLTAQFLGGTATNLFNSGTVDMDSIYYFINNNEIDNLNHYLGINDADTVELVGISFGCDTLHIPIEHCDKHTCDSIKFEEYLLAVLDTASVGQTITTYLPDYGAGDFNGMIQNMVDAGYNCEQLWNCWESVVQSYWNTASMVSNIGSNPPSSGFVPRQDLLMDFLNCTGYQIKGYTTTDIGTPGYLSHAYAYFNYTAGTNIPCEQASCGGNCTFDTTGFSDDRWSNFFLCVKYNHIGASNPGNTDLLATAEEIMDSCKSICNTRFDAFVSSLVDLYQGDTLAVAGYVWPTPDSLPALDTVPLSTVYCQAQNLVNKCSSQCDLTVFYDSYGRIDSVGTPAERIALAQAMSYNYDLAFDSAGYCSGTPAVSDSVDKVDLMVRFLNNQLYHVKDTTGSGGRSWNYLADLVEFEPALYATSMYTAMSSHPYVYVQPDVPSYFLQNTSPSLTRTDSVSCSDYTFKRTIQKNIQPGKNFTVTNTIVLINDLDSAADLTITDVFGSSLLRLVSGTATLTKHGPLAAGTQFGFSYVVHDSSAFYADSLYAGLIHGAANTKDTSITLYSDVNMVACPTIYYYFNQVLKPNSTVNTKPMVGTSLPSVGTPGVSYTSYEYITIDSLIRRDPKNNAFAYLFTNSFNVYMSSPNAAYFTRLSTALEKAVKDTMHVYVFEKPYWNSNLGYRPASVAGPSLLATYCGTQSSCSPVCLTWKAIEFPDSLVQDTIRQYTCAQQSAMYIKGYVASGTQRLIDKHRASVQQSYVSNCVNGASLLDHFSASYPLGYYHYTLYYYDRAGNLVKTVPPKGVVENCTTRLAHPAHSFITEYTPNSLKQVVRQKTPDGGETHFWYDNKSRLRFSQNAKQLVAGNYSYTIYDNLGRIIEVGELHNLDTTLVNSTTYPATGNETQRTITVYSNAAGSIAYFGNLPQRFLQNRVSYSITDVDGDLNTTADKVSTYFSYDPHGNVEWLIQEQPELGKTYIAYQYDLISGSVLQVNYNEELDDKFFHRYTYDTDKRIETVETSHDGYLWERDASYTYYPHGPLKRTMIGHDSVQGTDYVYTIQGWLKAMNHSSLDVDNDPSQDGKVSTAHQYTAKDVYGMVLGYFSGDFNRTGSAYNASNSYALNGSNLFNGNISSWTNNIGYVAGTLKREQLTGTKYRYDELNRIKLADFNYYDSGWNDTTTYDESFAYDANGNITSLTRNGYYNGTNVDMDNLTYHYAGGRNQLNYVNDAVSSVYSDDIDDQSANNYAYDSIGNLTADVAEGIDHIYWNVYGKIESIKKTNGDSLHFLYNAAGHRVSKEVIPYAAPHDVASTYYSVDASGNAMAIYNRSNSGSSPDYTATIKLAEQPIYGSERIGERRDTSITVATLPYTDSTPPVAGSEAIVHKDTLSPWYLPVLRSGGGMVRRALFSSIYSIRTNYAGVQQLNNEVPSINSAIKLGATNATQGKYAIELKDACGNVILSANSVTLQPLINRANPAVTQVCYVYDGSGNLLINSSGIIAGNQSQLSFVKMPGSSQQYYLFTVGADKKAYYHVIDLAQKKVISKNNLLDANAGYGLSMKVLEDVADGDGKSQLYLRRRNSTKDSTYLINFEISVDGIAGAHILTKFASKDVNGIGEIELNPDATKMLVSNTKGGKIGWLFVSSLRSGELKQFALNSSHDSVTGTTGVSTGIFTTPRSVAYNEDGTNIYYNKELFGVYSINKYSSTFTSGVKVVPANGSGDIRRGNDGKLYAAVANTAKIYKLTDGTTPTKDSLFASAGTKLTGGLQRVNNTISNGVSNCSNTDYFARNLNRKVYELKDHLQNVRVTISDMKLWNDLDADNVPDGGEFMASVESYNNYYAYHSIQPLRSYNSTDYRYGGANGQEKDNEILNINGALTAATYWEYDTRLGIRWNRDRVVKPWQSDYLCFSGNPVWKIDPNGDDDYYNEKGKFLYHTDTKTDDLRFITQKSFNNLKKDALNAKYAGKATAAQTALFKFTPEIKVLEANSVKIQVQTPEEQEKTIAVLEEKTSTDSKESGGYIVFDIEDSKNPKLYIMEDKTATRSENGVVLNGSEHYDSDPNTNYIKGSHKTQIVVGDIHTHPQGDGTYGPSTPNNTTDPNGANDQDLSINRNNAMFVVDKSIYSVIKGTVKDIGRKANVARESLKDYGKRK